MPDKPPQENPYEFVGNLFGSPDFANHFRNKCDTHDMSLRDMLAMDRVCEFLEWWAHFGSPKDRGVVDGIHALADATSRFLAKRVPYDKYLTSNHWRFIREQLIGHCVVDGKYQCPICKGDGPLVVHHRTYERLGCEHRDDLQPMCKDCHRQEHRK